MIQTALIVAVVSLFTVFRQVQTGNSTSSVGRRPIRAFTAKAMIVVPTIASTSVMPMALICSTTSGWKK